MQNHTTKRRTFSFMALLFGTRVPSGREAPTDPVPALSGFIYGEDAQMRLERIYTDAVELLRRAYPGLPYSRREIREHGLGPRRWQSAYQMLHHAGCLRQDGSMTFDEQTAARRKLYECRTHYEYLMRQGNHTLPF